MDTLQQFLWTRGLGLALAAVSPAASCSTGPGQSAGQICAFAEVL